MPDELDRILDMYDRRGVIGVPPTKLDRPEAKAQLNALFLKNALDLIEQNIHTVKQGNRHAEYIEPEEIIEAFQAKYGGK